MDTLALSASVGKVSFWSLYMKPEMIEGPQAQRNFEIAMKTAFSVSKTEITKVEKKDKAKRKRRKN